VQAAPRHDVGFAPKDPGGCLKLWGTQNPRFFEGTRVAKEAAAILATALTPTLAAAE
jgi:hypothetical protein